MKYYRVDLKVYEKKLVYDNFDQEYQTKICAKDIISFDLNHPFNNANEYIAWRKTIWDFAFLRSLEIWRKLAPDKVKASIGTLTIEAKKSLAGKLGLNNTKTCSKNKNGEWEYIKFFNKKYLTFSPLSEDAIKCCRNRAKKATREK